LIPDGDVQQQSANLSEPTKAKSKKVWTISKPIMKNTLQAIENRKEKSSSVLIPDGDVQQQSANQSKPTKAKSNKVWTISKPIIKNTLQAIENQKLKSSSVFIPDGDVQQQSANQSEPTKAKSVCFVCAKSFSSKNSMKSHLGDCMEMVLIIKNVKLYVESVRKISNLNFIELSSKIRTMVFH
jgi:precorrin-6B methylase 1